MSLVCIVLFILKTASLRSNCLKVGLLMGKTSFLRLERSLLMCFSDFTTLGFFPDVVEIFAVVGTTFPLRLLFVALFNCNSWPRCEFIATISYVALAFLVLLLCLANGDFSSTHFSKFVFNFILELKAFSLENSGLLFSSSVDSEGSLIEQAWGTACSFRIM